jgi:O-antigen/teichoic acid export membrane protein
VNSINWLIAKSKNLYAEAFWMILGQVLAMLGSLLSVKLLTTYLDINNYGKLSLGMTVVLFTAQLVMGPLGQGIQRYYGVALEKQQLYPYWRSVNSLLYKASVLITAIIVIILIGSYWIQSIDRLLLITGLAFSIVDGYNSTLIGIQNSARKRLAATIFSNLNIWLRLIVAVLLIRFFGAFSYVVLIAYVFVSGLLSR